MPSGTLGGAASPWPKSRDGCKGCQEQKETKMDQRDNVQKPPNFLPPSFIFVYGFISILACGSVKSKLVHQFDRQFSHSSEFLPLFTETVISLCRYRT